MDQFLQGATAMACGVVGVFFLRFWRETHDRLFVIFAVAFWLMGVNRIGLALLYEVSEHHTLMYLIRLFAFILILVAIVDKNRKRRAA